MEQIEGTIEDLNCGARNRRYVVIEREPFGYMNLYGFVLWSNYAYTLIASVAEQLMLDGFVLIRTCDIDRHEFDDYRREVVDHVLRSRYGEDYYDRILGAPANISALSDLDQIVLPFPLLAIYREVIDEDELFVGSLKKVTDKCLYMRLMAPDGEWDVYRRFQLKDITRIDFGGGYEEGLWSFSQHKKNQ